MNALLEMWQSVPAELQFVTLTTLKIAYTRLWPF